MRPPKLYDYGDMTEPVNFFQGVYMGLLFSGGMVALAWLMMAAIP